MIMETLIGEELGKSIKNIRVNNDNYEELVLINSSNGDLHETLTAKLGPAIKGSKIEQSEIIETAIQVANANGGIDDDQFLYGGEYESKKIVVMIWPWQDGKNLTIKKYII